MFCFLKLIGSGMMFNFSVNNTNLPAEIFMAFANINAVFNRSNDVMLLKGIRIFLSFANMKQKKQMNLVDMYILPWCNIVPNPSTAHA